MSSAPLIVSISGIRGLVGQSLTDEVVARFAAAFGTTLTPGATVVLARDTRPSGAAFAQAAAAALSQTGCRVVDLGKCSTPGAKLMVAALNAKGAIIITASHNPAPWNGLKLVRADGVFLNAEEGARVEALFHAGQFRCAASGELETLDPDAVVARHVQQIVDYVDADAIRRAGFKVAVDPCNGTGALVGSEPAGRLGRRSHLHQRAARRRFCPQPGSLCPPTSSSSAKPCATTAAPSALPLTRTPIASRWSIRAARTGG